MKAEHAKDAANLDRALLCLKCRHPGHCVSDCPSTHWPSETAWFISPLRKRFNFRANSDESLCERCLALNIPGLLNEDVKWNSRNDLNLIASKGSPHLQAIGKTGSIQYWSDCALCLCLFALTPNPSSEDQDVIIFPHWTIFRLEGSIVINTDKKRRYAKSIVVTLQPSTSPLAFEDRAMRGDALCFLQDDLLEHDKVLGGREIDPYRVNIELVKTWLTTCQQLHPFTCKPYWIEALRTIRLVNVDTCEIVQHPEQPCEYVALSYVWGNVEKQSFKLGSTLPPQLAQTIKDAMELVTALGKKYLWVDSYCIDQLDEDDKRAQIGMMSDIYRGAFATIIALSGTSANAGLPRIGNNQEVVPQLRCSLNKRPMVGLMPTLSSLLWSSPWALRAWTLQEACLSRRCIYISDFQVYFECNAMQCSESLDESQSYIHQLLRDVNADWSFENIGAGCLRHNLHRPGVARDPLLSGYGSRLVLYSYRSMTDSKDAIDAFSGILQDLRQDHGVEFHFGIPVQYFQWGLLWTARSTLKRRRPGDFPT